VEAALVDAMGPERFAKRAARRAGVARGAAV